MPSPEPSSASTVFANGDTRWEHPDSLSQLDPFAEAGVYYGAKQHSLPVTGGRPRGMSNVHSDRPSPPRIRPKEPPVRRASLDTYSHFQPRKFVIDVDSTYDELVAAEDTDGNHQITIEDGGPKVMYLGTANSNGFNKFAIRGTYVLSNLLQELAIAKDHGRKRIFLDERRLTENPVQRLNRLIKMSFWGGLTRVIDGSVVERVTLDPKAERMKDPRPRIYVPARCPEQLEYYKKCAEDRPELNLDVVQLPLVITPEYVKDINEKPGLLALAMEEYIGADGKKDLRGLPFVVPGGRFNELYGWDSYMIALGLLIDGKVNLAKSMVLNFCFEIEHYGKILNANRSYYLSRSQPPFLTDMAIRVYRKIKQEPGAKEFLKISILAAIKEYYTVWMSQPRLDKATGLSRYRPAGLGIPPETEPSHFDSTLRPYATKHNMTIPEFIEAYNDRKVLEPELDDYFLHDRAVRESGHDTTYRFEGECADLATVDLNSLLYKYEKDISRIIHEQFNDRLVLPTEFEEQGHPVLKAGTVFSSAGWDRKARHRKILIDKYLWNDKKGLYFDYNTKTKKQIDYESATAFWAMWAGVASPKQATKLVDVGLEKLEEFGGLVSGTERSRGELGLDMPNRQWDYPYGWAPQQILAWVGLERYGYETDARRLAYRWLFMITKAFFDYNGVVVEKYNVTRQHDPHRVDAEYGNQGLDFKGYAKEGFGWVNASYQYGLTLITSQMKRALGAMVPPDLFFQALERYDQAATEHLLQEYGLDPDDQAAIEVPADTHAAPTPAAEMHPNPFETTSLPGTPSAVERLNPILSAPGTPSSERVRPIAALNGSAVE